MTYEDYCKIVTLHPVFCIATGTLEEERFLKRLAKAVDYES